MTKKFILLLFTFLTFIFWTTTVVNAETIQEGDTGSHVEELQKILIAKGLLFGEADGIYGEATVNAVKKFQQSQGLKVDGICGDNTFNLLLDTVDTTINVNEYDDSNYVIKSGMQGSDVEELQNILIALGYMSGTADGVCGHNTVNAIKTFQSTHGLIADGICGASTFDAINIDAEAYMAGDTSVAYNANNQQSSKKTSSKSTLTGDNNSSNNISISTDSVIQSGSQGEAVKNLQRKLISLGYLSGDTDGICGDMTVAAIKKFQSSQNLEADGIAGAATLNKLNNPSSVTSEDNSQETTEEGSYAEIGSVIKAGMQGDGVIIVQQKLIEHGFLSGEPDGYCGARTVAAIKRFQTSVGLPADGVCGLLTYAALEDADYNTSDKSWDKSIIKNPRGKKMRVEATAYYPINGAGHSYTARGNILRRGIIAVDPRVIPLGTRVYIPGYGEAVADDIGGAIKGNIIDIAFDTYNEAINFGRQTIDIYILDD